MTFYIGLMSGTSADAADAVLVDISDRGGIELIAVHSEPFAAPVQQQVRQVAAAQEADLLHSGFHLDTCLGEFFANAALALLAASGHAATQVRAIGSHGQTVYHAPSARCTVQLGDGNVIAERTGITAVADFRRRDVAAGGQGAPLTPAFHHFAFCHPSQHRVIVNIGGIANITILPAAASAAEVTGFDTGPGNVLLDAWIARHRHCAYDDNGRWAASGVVIPRLLAQWMRDPYFTQRPPKSTGFEYFNLDWLDTDPQPALGYSAADVEHTLCALTAHTIAQSIGDYATAATHVFVCGGGAHNQTLMNTLRNTLAPLPVVTTLALGIAPDWVEAAAFAWLAHCALEGLPANLPRVTGARSAVILGAIYQR